MEPRPIAVLVLCAGLGGLVVVGRTLAQAPAKPEPVTPGAGSGASPTPVVVSPSSARAKDERKPEDPKRITDAITKSVELLLAKQEDMENGQKAAPEER